MAVRRQKDWPCLSWYLRGRPTSQSVFHVVPVFTRYSDIRKRGHVLLMFTRHSDVPESDSRSNKRQPRSDKSLFRREWELKRERQIDLWLDGWRRGFKLPINKCRQHHVYVVSRCRTRGALFVLFIFITRVRGSVLPHKTIRPPHMKYPDFTCFRTFRYRV